MIFSIFISHMVDYVRTLISLFDSFLHSGILGKFWGGVVIIRLRKECDMLEWEGVY